MTLLDFDGSQIMANLPSGEVQNILSLIAQACNRRRTIRDSNWKAALSQCAFPLPPPSLKDYSNITSKSVFKSLSDWVGGCGNYFSETAVS
jgi:hypothetical protein